MATHAHIHLAPLDTASHAERETTLLPRLAAAEQARYREFSAETRRHTWLAGRELLLAALAHTQGDADPARLLTAEHGGVRYSEAQVHLNLSHSGAWLAAAVADLSVGIDIERLRPRGMVAQAARVFCAREVQHLAGEIDPLPRFYRLWTLKEAACKAVGLTVWDALRRACFDLDVGRCHLSPPFPAGSWHFVYGDFAADWCLALALHGADDAPEVACWHRDGAAWRRMALSDPGTVAGG